MHWILNFLASHKHGSSITFTIFISLLLLTASPTNQQQIIQTLTMTIFFPVQVVMSQVFQLRDFAQENRVLQKRVTNLSLENASLKRKTEVMGEQLIDAQFRKKFLYELIPAQTIARDPSFLYRTIVIDVGMEEGVTTYMPVVNADGVVGKVIKVLRNSSLVQLIRAPSEYISVLHKSSGAVGILSAMIGTELHINYRSHFTVSEGDTLVTSGLGGVYPPNLNVGIVKRVETGEQRYYNKIVVEPMVNFNKLNTLYIVDIDAQWGAFREEIDSLLLEDEE